MNTEERFQELISGFVVGNEADFKRCLLKILCEIALELQNISKALWDR